LRGNGAHLRLRRKVEARRVPRWGAGVVDLLDSRRGAASCLAMVAPPPPPSVGEVTGQTRMLFFRHVGKTSLIPPPAGGLTAAIVAVAWRRKKYHVVAAVEGHELKTPETEHRPGLERLLETTHLELDGEAVRQHVAGPYLARQLSAFRPWGVPGSMTKLSLRLPAQMGRRETGHKGGRTVRGTRGLRVVLRPGRMDALAVGGYKRSRGREREQEPYALARSPARPTLSYESPGPSFYTRKERVQVYNRGCSSVLTCLAERS
jgi:hypothetical protein